MSIAADSPCTRPAKKHPDVIIDGVLPADLPHTWLVAYRLMCSECYLGGTGFLSSVQVNKAGAVRIIDTLPLKKSAEDEIPGPLEMTAEDADDDNHNESVLRYRTIQEKAYKCTGMQDAATYIAVVKTDKARIIEVLHEQLGFHPTKKGRPFVTAARFDDVNEDGYLDLVLTRTNQADVACTAKNAGCKSKGDKSTQTTQTVRRYAEETDDWGAPPFSGHALSDGTDIDCDVPLPETPFAVVAEILPGKQLTQKMENKARALRNAGFNRTCLYNGGDFEGLKADHTYVITAAHGTRGAADEDANTLRKAGFRPFVKELFR